MRLGIIRPELGNIPPKVHEVHEVHEVLRGHAASLGKVLYFAAIANLTFPPTETQGRMLGRARRASGEASDCCPPPRIQGKTSSTMLECLLLRGKMNGSCHRVGECVHGHAPADHYSLCCKLEIEMCELNLAAAVCKS